jgi:hypothetical protein
MHCKAGIILQIQRSDFKYFHLIIIIVKKKIIYLHNDNLLVQGKLKKNKTVCESQRADHSM